MQRPAGDARAWQMRARVLPRPAAGLILDELEAVMMRYALAAQEDKERFGLGRVLDLFADPPPEP